MKKFNRSEVYYKGNIKLIGKINKGQIKDNNKSLLLNKRFWLAASTHKEEDIICIKTHLLLKKEFKNVITIIAPRHIDRANEIKSLSEKFQLKAQILNKNKNILQDKEIIIINHFGALNSYFKYAKSVFIGKSMIKKLKHEGGQNPIEAAKLGCRIYYGPYVYNFEDIYRVLKNNKISKQVKDYIELSKNLTVDIKKNNKKLKKNNNSIDKLGQKTFVNSMPLINDFLNNEFK